MNLLLWGGLGAGLLFLLSQAKDSQREPAREGSPEGNMAAAELASIGPEAQAKVQRLLDPEFAGGTPEEYASAILQMEGAGLKVVPQVLREIAERKFA